MEARRRHYTLHDRRSHRPIADFYIRMRGTNTKDARAADGRRRREPVARPVVLLEPDLRGGGHEVIELPWCKAGHSHRT